MEINKFQVIKPKTSLLINLFEETLIENRFCFDVTSDSIDVWILYISRKVENSLGHFLL